MLTVSHRVCNVPLLNPWRFTNSSSLGTTVKRRHVHFDATTGLTEMQLDIQKSAHAFALAELAPHVRHWDAHGIFPRDALQAGANYGYGGLNVHVDYGGSGLSRSDTAVVYETLGGVDVSTTAYLTLHNMCGWMIDQYGTEQQKRLYLPDLTSCRKFASYCLTEPDYGSDAANLNTRAVLSSDQRSYILNGTKAFISGGSMSDVYIVLARTGTSDSGAKGVTAFIVDKHTPGISFGSLEDKMGWRTQPTCNVIMDDCIVPINNVLGKINHGFKIAMGALNGSRINISAAGIGAAITCYNKSVEYVKNRKQFSQTLSNLQSVQFKIADMYSKIYVSRMCLYDAARSLDTQSTGQTQTMIQVAVAKQLATDLSYSVIDESLQVHGGYGYMKEYEIERHLRDTRVHKILGGTSEIMQLLIGRYALRD